MLLHKRPIKPSIVIKYVTSYFGVIILTCAFVGLILYSKSVEEFSNANEKITLEKLSVFASDMENQQKAMAEVSYMLCTEIYYKKFYIKRNKYYEVHLFENFQKYKNNTQISLDYFFMYHGDEWVYKTNFAKNTFDVFCKCFNITSPQDKLYERLNTVDEFTIIPCISEESELLIFAWPVYTSGKFDLSSLATLGFFVSGDKLYSRFLSLVGDIPGDIFIFHNGVLLTTLKPSSNSAPDISKINIHNGVAIFETENGIKRFICDSPSGEYRIVLDAPSSNLFVKFDIVSTSSMLYIFIVIFLMLSISAYVGYSNYKPIKKLKQNIKKKAKNLNSNIVGGNELEFIEQVFDDILHDKEVVEHNMQYQYELLKKQILRLLISGDNRYAKLVSKSFMGIRLPGPFYGVIAIEFASENLTIEQENEFAFLFEELSGENMFFYFTGTQRDNYYAVIISLLDDGLFDDACEYVIALLDEKCLYRIGVSSLCTDIKNLNETYLTAVANCTKNEKSIISENVSSLIYDEAVVNKMFTAIKAGAYDEAEYLIDHIVYRIHECYNSFLVEKYIYYNIIYRLNSYANRVGIVIRHDLLINVLAADNLTKFVSEFKLLVYNMCEICANVDGIEEKSIQQEPKNDYLEIIEYMNKNYNNYNLTLGSLAAHFGLSNKHTSRLIKELTGKTYQDYLTLTRISKAQELLITNNYTVTEVCQMVGYMHLSHFIRTFKRITGVTPSNYQKEE